MARRLLSMLTGRQIFGDEFGVVTDSNGPGLQVRLHARKLPVNAYRLAASLLRDSASTGRIFLVPQLDGRPSWEPQPTPLTANHGARARSSVRRLRSRSRTSGQFEFVFRWRTGCVSSHSSTLALAASF